MADLTLQVTPGEVLELYPAERVEPYVQQHERPPGEWFIAQTTADANGVATFTGVTPRVEYYAMRPDFRFIKTMHGVTSGKS